MKKTPNGPFWLGAVALSLATMFTACQSAPTRTAAELRRLQGYWDGDGAGGKCSITITGNTLHFHARTDFWYKATFTLPAGTGPQQLRAIINDGAQGKTDSTVGKVVVAVFKIEDGTLTLAVNQDSEGPPPNAFPSERDGPIARYDLKKVQSQK